MRYSFFIMLAFMLSAALLSAVLTPALAQSQVGTLINDQLQPVQQVYGGPNVTPNTLSQTIAQIIQVVLGFLGVIFVVLIVYAGFMWMTSAGNEEKIKKAKQTMVAAIIGTAIVLAAYAITSFVINQLLNATGAQNG